MTHNSWVPWWYGLGSLPAVTIPREGEDVNLRKPTPGYSPIQNYIGEAFNPHNIPCNGGKAGVEFITSNDWKISGEGIPMVILVTDGVGEGKLEMVTTFCCHDQARMEASNALSALCQCDLPKPSMVVVRRYTNTPYIPWGTFHLLYLDMSTLLGGTSSTKFPLDWLCLHKLLLFSDTDVVLPQKEGEVGLKVFPISNRLCGKVQKRTPSSQTQFCCWSLYQPQSLSRRGQPVRGRIGLPLSTPAFIRYQPGQRSAGMWVGPGGTGVSQKIWQSVDQIGQETWKMASRDGQKGWCHLSRDLFPGKLNQLNQVAALVHLLHSSPLLHEWSTGHHYATGWGHPSYDHCTWTGGSTGSRPLKQSSSLNWNSASSSTSLTGYPLCWYSPSGMPICWVHCQPQTEKAGPLFQWLTWQSS